MPFSSLFTYRLLTTHRNYKVRSSQKEEIKCFERLVSKINPLIIASYNQPESISFEIFAITKTLNHSSVMKFEDYIYKFYVFVDKIMI